MVPTDTLAVLCGLGSALAWGAGDFSGGYASRQGSAPAVILFAQLIGGALLLVIAITFAQTIPPVRHLVFGALAGVFGVLGLIGFYKGLAQGRMGLVAPLSAVATAVLPLTFSFLVAGSPGWLRIIGFVVALTAVWLIASPGAEAALGRQELRLSLWAGLGFGLFFIFMGQASDKAVLWPLVAARVSSIVVMFTVLAGTRRLAPPPPGRQFHFIALAGILDVAGNAAFAMAAHLGRLDIATILASLYPAPTILLAWLIFRERLNRRQWSGVTAAGAALVMIAW